MASFILKKFPDILDDISTTMNTVAAEKTLAKYDGMVEVMFAPEILTTVLFYQESVMSSRIEGTVATISDILNYRVGKDVSEKTEMDAAEIENYKDALGYCIKEAEENNFNITNRLIKSIQSMLLHNSLDKDKLKGKFKERQNYIGNKFDHEITYIPVSHMHTEEYMDNLVSFINSDTKMNPLIKTAIIHAYFELVHPFEDGNGRVGRILIPILMRKYDILSTPYFYISYFLSVNRTRYIGALENISKNNDWNPWISFFIEAVEKQTAMLIQMLRRLKEIREKTEHDLSLLKSQFSIQILRFLFRQIKFTTTKFISETAINSNTAWSLLRSMEKIGIIEIDERGSGPSPKIYRFKELYRMVEDINS